MNAQFEVRQARPGGPITLEGYAAVFNEPYTVETRSGDFRETVKRGAFARSLAKGPDVYLSINHAGHPLARTTSGTLTLREDARGLRFSAQLEPSDHDVQRLVPKLRRGDMNEASFSFRADRQTWNSTKTVRTLHAVSIDRGDVSIVNFAANPNATVSMRGRQTTLEQRNQRAARIGASCGPWMSPASTRRPRTDHRGRRELAKIRDRRDLREAQRIPAAVVTGQDADRLGEYSPREVQSLGESGYALQMPDGTYGYVIVDSADLLNALACYQQAEGGKPPGLHAWIILRANILRLTHLLPAGWGELEPGLQPKRSGQAVVTSRRGSCRRGRTLGAGIGHPRRVRRRG